MSILNAMESNGMNMESNINIVDEAWGADQPAKANNDLIIHPIEYAGMNMI